MALEPWSAPSPLTPQISMTASPVLVVTWRITGFLCLQQRGEFYSISLREASSQHLSFSLAPSSKFQTSAADRLGLPSSASISFLCPAHTHRVVFLPQERKTENTGTYSSLPQPDYRAEVLCRERQAENTRSNWSMWYLAPKGSVLSERRGPPAQDQWFGHFAPKSKDRP